MELKGIKRKEKVKRIIEEYPYTPTAVLAEKYGMEKYIVRNIAKQNGVKKDLAAQRAYKEAHKPPSRKVIINQLAKEYPFYGNEYLAEKYGMTVQQVQNVAASRRLKKDYNVISKRRKDCMKEVLADYATRPTHEIAKELGISEDNLRRMASRAGISKTVKSPPRRKKTIKERMVLAFAKDYTVAEISAKAGVIKTTVRAILKRNGITPKPSQT